MRINYIDYEGVKRTKKRKMYIPKWLLPGALAIVSLTTVATVSSDVSARENDNVAIVDENNLGSNILTSISISINEGDTLSDIANRYYTEENALYYSSIDSFASAISSQNQIRNKNMLTTGQHIEIPIVVTPDNPYYVQLKVTEDILNNFSKENIWVEHTVEIGDNLYSLASLSCNDPEDILKTVEEIKRHNNINSSNIMLGSVIKIKNPELAILKQNINDAKEAFINSLIQGQKTY